MLRFIVRRLLLLIPILFGLSILVFVWIRALPGSPGELAARRARDRRRRSRRSTTSTASTARSTSSTGATSEHAGRQPRQQHRVARGRSRSRSSSASRRRSSSRSRRWSSRSSSASRSASSPRSSTVVVRPHEPLRLADRDLDPDLLPGADPQVHLRREARLAAEHRPRGRDQRRRRTRRTSTSSTGSSRDPAAFWDAIKHLILPAIASARSRSPSSRGSRARPCSTSRTRTTCARRAPRACRAAHGRPPARAAQRDAARLDDHRPPDRPAALGRGAHRDGLRVSRGSAPGCGRRSSTATTR